MIPIVGSIFGGGKKIKISEDDLAVALLAAKKEGVAAAREEMRQQHAAEQREYKRQFEHQPKLVAKPVETEESERENTTAESITRKTLSDKETEQINAIKQEHLKKLKKNYLKLSSIVMGIVLLFVFLFYYFLHDVLDDKSTNLLLFTIKWKWVLDILTDNIFLNYSFYILLLLASPMLAMVLFRRLKAERRKEAEDLSKDAGAEEIERILLRIKIKSKFIEHFSVEFSGVFIKTIFWGVIELMILKEVIPFLNGWLFGLDIWMDIVFSILAIQLFFVLLKKYKETIDLAVPIIGYGTAIGDVGTIEGSELASKGMFGRITRK